MDIIIYIRLARIPMEYKRQGIYRNGNLPFEDQREKVDNKQEKYKSYHMGARYWLFN